MDKDKAAQPAREPCRKPNYKAFMEWAGDAGYDTAYTINSNNGEFMALSPMTTDLWGAWQAALAQPVQQSLTAPQSPWLKYVKGVRVDGDNVVISCKGSEGANEAARTLCRQILAEKGRSTTSGGA